MDRADEELSELIKYFQNLKNINIPYIDMSLFIKANATTPTSGSGAASGAGGPTIPTSGTGGQTTPQRSMEGVAATPPGSTRVDDEYTPGTLPILSLSVVSEGGASESEEDGDDEEESEDKQISTEARRAAASAAGGGGAVPVYPLTR